MMEKIYDQHHYFTDDNSLPVNVYDCWEKVGLFQSFAEIEQLNAMVEPQNLV